MSKQVVMCVVVVAALVLAAAAEEGIHQGTEHHTHAEELHDLTAEFEKDVSHLHHVRYADRAERLALIQKLRPIEERIQELLKEMCDKVDTEYHRHNRISHEQREKVMISEQVKNAAHHNKKQLERTHVLNLRKLEEAEQEFAKAVKSKQHCDTAKLTYEEHKFKYNSIRNDEGANEEL